MDEIAFGLPLLRGYYNIFDVTNDQLGIAPSSVSSKIAIVAGSVSASTTYFIAPVPWHTQVSNFFKNNKDWWIFGLGSVIVIMGLLTMLLWSGIFDKDNELAAALLTSIQLQTIPDQYLDL